MFNEDPACSNKAQNISENNISSESKKTLDLEKNVEIRVQMHVPVKKYKESEHLEILMNLVKNCIC